MISSNPTTETLILLAYHFYIAFRIPIVAALSLGYASHLAGDACTRTGIPLFYPQRKNYHLLPIRIRVVTGSEYEELFFVVFAMLNICLLMARLIAFGS